MISLTTESIPTRERAEFWGDLVSRHVTPVRIEPAGDHAVRGEIQARAIGKLGVAQVSGHGLHAWHTGEHVARAGGHVYAVGVHLEGQARLVRGGESVDMQRGDIVIIDSRREFMWDHQRYWRHLLITLPTDSLERRVARPDSLAGAVLRDRPLARLWAAHLAAGFTLAGELEPAAATLFARHSLDLLAHLLDESHQDNRTAAEASHDAMFVSACHVIALRCGEPDLTPDEIARDIGVSSRTLARVFAARNETVMRRVFDERVSQAARLLASPSSAHRSVTDIAFACGFNDLSHFGRMFAGKMQMTPSRWRRRAR